MTNDKKYDLKERTLKFSHALIKFCRSLPQNQINNPIISQVVRSGTSIGANYAEADAANSKKDFINKISIAKKEASETKYWLQILAEAAPEKKVVLRSLFKEAQELNLIFSAIIRSAKGLDIKT